MNVDIYGFSAVALLVLLIGTVIYWVTHQPKPQDPIILDAYPKRTSAPWYLPVLYVAGLAPWLFAKYIFAAGASAPIIGGAIGVMMFAFMCLANWYSPLRRKVNYWLTLQQDDRLAAAWAEPTLYSLNGLFVFTSGILVVLSFFFLESA
jgi:hypothetical protein